MASVYCFLPSLSLSHRHTHTHTHWCDFMSLSLKYAVGRAGNLVLFPSSPPLCMKFDSQTYNLSPCRARGGWNSPRRQGSFCRVLWLSDPFILVTDKSIISDSCSFLATISSGHEALSDGQWSKKEKRKKKKEFFFLPPVSLVTELRHFRPFSWQLKNMIYNASFHWPGATENIYTYFW